MLHAVMYRDEFGHVTWYVFCPAHLPANEMDNARPILGGRCEHFGCDYTPETSRETNREKTHAT